MIFLGLSNQEKDIAMAKYCADHQIQKVFALTPEKFKTEFSFRNTEHVEYTQIIEYKPFYRLLQEIDKNTLVVINECLRTQNRYDLTYNCIRHFLNQAGHQIVFQYLPIIEDQEDFMILFDFDTRSRWKREKFRPDLLSESAVRISSASIKLSPIKIECGPKVQMAYQIEKEKLIAGIGLKDPHTIPRNLYLMSGKAKLKEVDPARHYIGRNNRFKIETMQAYRESRYPHEYTVFEFCHNFIDFTDFLSLSRQVSFDVLVADLKVDQWYLQRYQNWIERLNACYSEIYREPKRLGCGA